MTAAGPKPVFVVESSHGWASLRLQDLWEYRELLYFLTWREVKVRYKQTALGAAWAVLQPFFTMLVFSVFFGRLAKMPSDGIPYPVFAYTALVPWMFFANGLTHCSGSVVSSANLITKVYFPRVLIPVSAVMSGAVDFLCAFVLLIGMAWHYGVVPSGNAGWALLLFAIAFAAALGAGLWLAAWNVKYRDIRYVVPFVTQFWMFASPIAYPSSLVPEGWRTVYAINPMVGVVEGFRWALLGAHTKPAALIAVSGCVAIALLVSGLFYFRRLERTFADVV